MGGAGASGGDVSALSSVYMYDPQHPALGWLSISNMPAARDNFSAESVNGKIYAIGGYDGSSYQSTVFEGSLDWGVAPTSGPSVGGNTVTITGLNLGAGDVTSVTLCGSPANILVDHSPTQIVVRAGASSVSGAGDVVVHSTSAGVTTSENAYTYAIATNSVLLQAGNGGMAGLWRLGTNAQPATWTTISGPLGAGWVLRAINQSRILLQQGNGGMIGLWDLDANSLPVRWWLVSAALPGWIARDLDGNRILLQAGDGGAIGLWTLGASNTPVAWKSLSAPLAGFIARALHGKRILLQRGNSTPIGYWTLDDANNIIAWTPINVALPPDWVLRSMTESYILLQADDGGMAGLWDLDPSGQPAAWHTITGPLPGWILRSLDQH